MHIELSDEQRGLQSELRDYFGSLVTADEARELLVTRHGDTYREVVRRMGRDGRLGVGWPTEFGGRGFGQLEQTIFVNEAARRDIPLPYVTLQTVGPVLQRYGTPEQKDLFLAASSPATSTSRSATPNRPRAPTSPTCARPPCATATSTS